MDFLKVSDRTATPYRSNSLFGLNQQQYKDMETHPHPHLITPYAGNGVVGCYYYHHPFTNAQLKELERQAMIYKYMIASVPVPFDLLVSASPCNNNKNMAGDLEPGRCRRTDGKKWRCSKEVVFNHKYCERHLHRGRPRSRKHVKSPYSRPINNDPKPKEISSYRESRARTEQENKYLNFIDIWSDGVKSSEKQSTKTTSTPVSSSLDLSIGGNNLMGQDEMSLIQMGLGVSGSDHGYGPYGIVPSWLAPTTPGGPLAEILRPNPNLAYSSTPTPTPKMTASMSDESSQI